MDKKKYNFKSFRVECERGFSFLFSIFMAYFNEFGKQINPKLYKQTPCNIKFGWIPNIAYIQEIGQGGVGRWV